MKPILSLLAVSVFCVLFSPPLDAQTKTGKVHGSVVSAEGKTIDGATVTLLRAKDSVLVKAAVSSKTGDYDFEALPNGKFFVKVTAVGFRPKTSEAFELSATENSINVPSLSIAVADKNLGNVQVTAVRPLIENKIDKMVVNVDASPTNTGLSALEVLEKSPGVLVDNDGNISVKGKSGVIILMDGKPAYLSGQDLANYLRNLPSNQLDQIEIMTQPSAKFDASGNSGIINIKTKKNKADGFNGNISTSAIIANYFKNTNSINVNLRKGKVNVFANYGYSYWEGFTEFDLVKKFRANEKSNFFRYSNQNTYGRFSGRPHNFKAGVDYFSSKSTTLGVVVNGLVDTRVFASETNANFYDSLNRRDQYNISKTKNIDPWTNLGFNLNFRQLIGTKGKELTADADYIFYRTKGKQTSDNYLYDANGNIINNTSLTNPYLLRGYLPGDIDIYSFKMDYVQPLQKNAKLEAGVKTSYVITDNDAQYTTWSKSRDVWFTDTARSNHFIYKEMINAAYVNVQTQIKKWGIQVGLRVEQTVSKGNQVVKNSKFDKDYTKVFPTTYISYQLNDKNTLGLSYGRRIERPGYQDLNPFQYLLDRYSFLQGNPLLQPQFSHNVELSYNYKGQLNIATNYTKTTDIINDVIKNEKTGENFTSYRTKENVASRVNVGIAISYNKPLTKWWSINAFANAYNNYYKGIVNNELISLDITALSGNLSNQFTFKKGWSAELSGFYNSKNLVSSVILAKPMGMFALGVGKQVLNNKGSIRVNIRDPFYLMKFRGNTEMATFTNDVNVRWDNRRFIVTLVYRFGKSTQQQSPRKRTGAAQDEQNRVNLGNGQQ
jgi:outer membrane receptor protein involved in Fe transport